MNDVWTLKGFNASDEILGEGGDAPLQPGDMISAVITESEDAARKFLKAWLTDRSLNRKRLELWRADTLVETYYTGKENG